MGALAEAEAAEEEAAEEAEEAASGAVSEEPAEVEEVEAEVAPAVNPDADDMPANVSLERPGRYTPVIVPADVLGASHKLRMGPSDPHSAGEMLQCGKRSVLM